MKTKLSLLLSVERASIVSAVTCDAGSIVTGHSNNFENRDFDGSGVATTNKASGLTAFTLIELLAVIAIIAVLAAILFSSLQGVMEKSRSTKCLSNLRQIGIGFSLYSADNDGQLPSQKTGAVVEPSFWTALAPYQDWPKNRKAGPNAASDTIGHCPNHTEYPGSFSYVGSRNLILDPTVPPVRLLNIANPSRKILLYEVHTLSWWPNVGAPSDAGKRPFTPPWKGHGAHGRGAETFNNNLFADFHVESWPADGASFRWYYTLDD